jgi:hypothetical protein
MKTILDIISILGFILVSVLCLIAVKFGSDWAMKMMDTIIPMVITCWITNFTTIVNYHYGTSASSQQKSETISNVLSRIKTPTT